MKISKITRALINSGVTPELKIEEAQVVRLTNLFGMIPMVFFVIYIINGLIYDIDFFWKIGLVNMLFNLLAIYCNYKQWFALSRTVLLTANSLILFLLVNIVEGNSSGVAFFFPVLSCYVVFYDVMRELRIVLINLSITSACILLCLILPDQTLGAVSLPPYMSGNITKMNYLLAFTAFAFYIFTIIKVKLQSETLLIQSIHTAEIMAGKSDQVLNQLTEQKQKAEHATRTKALHLAQVSQEIRHPLERIMSNTELIAEQGKHEGVAGGGAADFQNAVTKIMETINEVDDLHKCEEGKVRAEKKIFNLHNQLNGLKREVQTRFPAPGFNLTMEIDGNIAEEIISDDKKLVQALHILISHGIRFYHTSDMRLVVASAASRTDQVTISFSVHWRDERVKPYHDDLTLPPGQKNTGPHKIFRLALCERLVELLGGRLSFTQNEQSIRAEFSVPVKLVSSSVK